jgi:CO/xanthine dehydrogenase Mo-binding subunit
MNPQIVTGLVYGGTVRGIDAALLSQYVYSDRGQLLPSSFEVGYMTIPAAIVSAIENAVSDSGLHLTAIPITPGTLPAILKASPQEGCYGHFTS